MPQYPQRRFNFYSPIANILVPSTAIVAAFCFWVIILLPIVQYASPQNDLWASVILIFCLLLCFMWAILCGHCLSRYSRNKLLSGVSPPFGFYVLLYAISTYIFFVVNFAYAYKAANKFGGQVLYQSEAVVDGEIQATCEPLKLLWDYIYFSSITACSLSFDLVPTKIARYLAALEVFTFWIFVVLRSVILREQ